MKLYFTIEYAISHYLEKKIMVFFITLVEINLNNSTSI